MVHQCARRAVARLVPAVLLLTALLMLILSAAGPGRAQAAPGIRAAGTVLWTRVYQDPVHLDDLATDVAASPNGDVCEVGTINSGSSPEALPGIRLARYTAGGRLVWQRFFGGGSGESAWATALAVNRYGDIFVVGSASGTGGSDLLVLSCTAGGTLKWVRRTHGPGQGSAAGFRKIQRHRHSHRGRRARHRGRSQGALVGDPLEARRRGSHDSQTALRCKDNAPAVENGSHGCHWCYPCISVCIRG